MLDRAARLKIVQDIESVYETRTQLPLLTKKYPDMELEDAYRIQEEFVARRVREGRRVRGYKVGLTSKVMQEMVGSNEPDFGAMTDDLFFPESTVLDAGRFLTPFVEMEIAFVFKERLEGPHILPLDVVRATDFVVPAIEICDFRIAYSPEMLITDTVADLAACGGVILGANPRRLDQLDLRTLQGEIMRNGVTEGAGEASAVMGNPVTAVTWLANKLAQFGIAFEPGQVVLSGSFVRALPLEAGDEIRCRFDQGLGDVVTSLG